MILILKWSWVLFARITHGEPDYAITKYYDISMNDSTSGLFLVLQTVSTAAAFNISSSLSTPSQYLEV